MQAISDEWPHITDGKFIILILLVPLFIAVIFGYVFKNNSLQDAPLAVVDLDHSNYSRQLIGKLDSSQYIQVLKIYDNYIEPDMLLYNERYSGVLCLPAGLEKAYIQGKPINVGLNLDMTLSVSANTIRSGISEVIGTENAEKGLSGVMVLEQRTLYNPTNQTMFMVIMYVNICILYILTFFTITIIPRLRQEGILLEVLKQPFNLLARALPYALITCASLYLMIGVLKQVGGLRFEVNWVQMIIPFFLYSFSSILLTILIGWTKSSTPKIGRAAIILIPSFLFSGPLVAYALLPTPLKLIVQLLPLSLHFKFLRGLGYKGGDLSYFVPDLGHYIVIIGLFMACILVLSAIEIRDMERTQTAVEENNSIQPISETVLDT
jgi:ABC-2 type transport system permease protein